MIAGSDFRIGNYALDDDRVIIIDGLKDYVVYYRDKKGLGIEHSVPMAVTEPILITEDWLLKFGFDISTWSTLALNEGTTLRLGRTASKNGLPLHICIEQEIEEGFTIKQAAEIQEHDKIDNDRAFIMKHRCLVLEPPIQYVHQLQNLFFALVGQELTVKEYV